MVPNDIAEDMREHALGCGMPVLMLLTQGAEEIERLRAALQAIAVFDCQIDSDYEAIRRGQSRRASAEMKIIARGALEQD